MGYYDEDRIKQRVGPDEIVPDYLEKGLIEPNGRVLEIGCGNGRNIVYLMRKGVENVVGIDNNYSADMIGIGKEMFGEDLPIEEGDMTRTRFPDNSFDVILALSVLHFCQIPERYDPDKSLPLLGYVLDEMERVAKTGAIIIVSDYSDQSTHPDFRRYIDKLGSVTAEEIIDEFERRGYERLDRTGPVSYGRAAPDDTDTRGKLFFWLAYRMRGG